MSVQSYEFFGAEEDEQASLLAELRTLLAVPDSVASDGPRRVRQHLTTGFACAGWACDVSVTATRSKAAGMLGCLHDRDSTRQPRARSACASLWTRIQQAPESISTVPTSRP